MSTCKLFALSFKIAKGQDYKYFHIFYDQRSRFKVIFINLYAQRLMVPSLYLHCDIDIVKVNTTIMISLLVFLLYLYTVKSQGHIYYGQRTM